MAGKYPSAHGGGLRRTSMWGLVVALAALVGASWPAEGSARDEGEDVSRKRDVAVSVASVATVGPRTGSLDGFYTRVSPAVVGITCRRGGERYFGTGVIVDPSGLVLTSVTVVPAGAREVRVYLANSRVHRAILLEADATSEFSLLEIEVPGRGGRREAFSYLRLGDSSSVRVGDPAFTLGNAFESLQDDGKVVFAAGIVSGLYELAEQRYDATYLGPAIETTAALNNGMDGGPLLDRDGNLIGVLSLNYERRRWLGTAVPINFLKPLIGRHRGWLDDREERFPAYAGFELEVVGGEEVRVLRLRAGGPAALAGLRPGDRIVAMDGDVLRSLGDVRERLASARPGSDLALIVDGGDGQRSVTIHLGGRF